MQYVKSIGGSVSKTWNSINPATLSGAIDVIVIEQEDGTLACSPFHVRFGKFSLLRPYEKKVEFNVNGVKQEYAMKLGEGGEAFFVFETTDEIPASLQTSPLVSPADSPNHRSEENLLSSLQEPEFLDLDKTSDNVNKDKEAASAAIPVPLRGTRSTSDLGMIAPLSPPPDDSNAEMSPGDRSKKLDRTLSEGALSSKDSSVSDAGLMEDFHPSPHGTSSDISHDPSRVDRSQSPPPLSPEEAVSRALSLSKKLSVSKIPSHVNETGDLMLDMTGYKSNEDDALRAEVVARKILAEELEGNYDIGALIGADEHGNLWIYSSEEAKEAANHRATFNSLRSKPAVSDDTISDPGYHSEGDAGVTEPPLATRHTRAQSDIQPGFPTSRQSLTGDVAAWDPNRNYAKTLRLTSDQLKALNLKPGANTMSFSVNKAICTATMYMWSGSTPIVISDIDGTITKSDALGHVLNMIGRDWTHAGVAKLYTDIVNNGYNIMYLTSRSVGQADTTRAYLFGVCQDGYRLPKGPVIMSPDRTMAALRREVYLKKPEVFKMACLRDILGLFAGMENPFYAGFGNRLTDALSYRLNKYKSSYVSMRELVDHFFPPVKLLVQPGGEDFTDFTYWRDTPKNLEDFSATDSEEEAEDEGGEEEEEEEGEEEEEEEDGEEEGEEDEDEEVYSDAELSDEVDSDVDGSYGEELGASYISQGSENTNLADSMINSVINDQSVNSEDEDAGEDGGDAETDGSKLASPHLTHLSTV